MKLQVSLAATPKYTPDTELLPIIFKWVFGSAATRAVAGQALLKCKIRPEYLTSGPMYRQLTLPQRLVEAVNDPKASAKTVVMELNSTPLSSWTKNKSFAVHFIAQGGSSTKSMVIIKRSIKKEECLIYLPNFVKFNNLTVEDYTRVAKSKTVQFMLRMKTDKGGEAEAIIVNNPQNLKVTKGQVIHINHSTTKFTGLIRKIKAAYPEIETDRLSDSLRVRAKSGTRDMDLRITVDGLYGRATRMVQKGPIPSWRIYYAGEITFEVFQDVVKWAYARSAALPMYVDDSAKPTVRISTAPSILGTPGQRRLIKKPVKKPAKKPTKTPTRPTRPNDIRKPKRRSA